MKKYFIIPAIAFIALFAATSCSEWDDHYDEANIASTSNVIVYDGTISDFIKSAQGTILEYTATQSDPVGGSNYGKSDISKMATLFVNTGIANSLDANQSYTLIACENEGYDENNITDAAAYTKYCTADMALAPSVLKDGFGIQTRLGKQIWINGDGDNQTLDGSKIKVVVKANNGYVYVIDKMLSIHPSVYEYLLSLGDEYSTFKNMVTKYDYEWFDKENSTIIGIAQDGSTLYDSVKVIRNTLMDRYYADGQPMWNMRDEQYNSTLFIPTNDQVSAAIEDACAKVSKWFNGREATEEEKAKFEEWIVKACFVDKKLDTEQVGELGELFECVGGCREIVDVAADKTTYESIDAAYWHPGVQRANTSDAVQLSNGVAYHLNKFKIPNHVIISRVKARHYIIWDALGAELQGKYYKWNGLTEPKIVNDAQGSFYNNTTTMGDWPDINYHVITAIPTEEAVEDSAICSVEYTGLVSDDNETYYECNLPAGEYNLRMGFVHSLKYSLSVYFQDEIDIEDGKYQVGMKDVAMSATASNFHFDRGGASDIPNYGDTYNIGYPDGYDPASWLEINENAYLYDTDGWQVNTVTMKKEGTFKIRVESKNMSRIWGEYIKANPNYTRDKNNKNQLMMYHWCLRPTPNNY